MSGLCPDCGRIKSNILYAIRVYVQDSVRFDVRILRRRKAGSPALEVYGAGLHGADVEV